MLSTFDQIDNIVLYNGILGSFWGCSLRIKKWFCCQLFAFVTTLLGAWDLRLLSISFTLTWRATVREDHFNSTCTGWQERWLDTPIQVIIPQGFLVFLGAKCFWCGVGGYACEQFSCESVSPKELVQRCRYNIDPSVPARTIWARNQQCRGGICELFQTDPCHDFCREQVYANSFSLCPVAYWRWAGHLDWIWHWGSPGLQAMCSVCICPWLN